MYKRQGEDFILQAFRFARKYAKQDVSLFYNDYDTFIPWKRDVICEQDVYKRQILWDILL